MHYILLLILLLVTPAFSQDSSLLWEITGNGMKDTSYLYGTFHIGDQRVFAFGDSLKIAFTKSKLFAGEAVLDKSASMEISKEIFMPKGITLKRLIGKADYRKVKKKARKSLPLFVGVVNNIKPFYTSQLIVSSEFRNDRGTTLDEYFQDWARKENKAVVGLESIKELVEAVDKISLEDQAMMLVEGLNPDSSSSVEIASDELLQNYLQQNINALVEELEIDSADSDFEKYILKDRNVKMVNRMQLLMNQQPSFIAVGAAHLGGQKGLIELLKAAGFGVRPVKAPFKNQ